ncbi:type II toxin-antitoxin system RelE/ParE family toxin [Marinobacter sp. SBS5]|uniref:type II toxin-antitoxin system RelE/ParE family toxin n=1 Tax=Marinobacter sp. SBS5 TaxID=3401754 RepID=UPI003AAF6C34
MGSRSNGHLIIKSFRHKGLKRFYSSANTPGIQPDHATKLRMQLAVVDFEAAAKLSLRA